jgi:hypothetical protein
MDPRPRHHRPRHMTQHPQPPLRATAHRVAMGSNWMGTMGAVGHDEGERNKTVAKWERNDEKTARHTHPASQATAHGVDCAWNDDNDDHDKQPQQNNGTTTGRRRGRGKPNKKKAQETLSTSLGPQVLFLFFFLISFSLY